jgi:hypothetical protein
MHHKIIYIGVQLDDTFIFVILFKTTLNVLGVPCPSSGDLTLPGQP